MHTKRGRKRHSKQYQTTLRAISNYRKNLAGHHAIQNVIHRAYSLIPKSYLDAVYAQIVRDVKIEHVSAGDSTDMSERRYEQWIDYRTDKIKSRKEWIKLHTIIDVKTRIILAYFITNSRVTDIPALYTMLDKPTHRL